jgi:outer membrane lipopolysaccharide assembly protein LptE/RlpB
MRSITNAFMKFFTLGLLTLLLAACGSKLDGIYADARTPPMYELKFKSNGTVIQSLMGMEAELKYEVEDKSVKLITGDNSAGKLVLKLRDDGSIEHPMMGLLSKRK